MIDTFVSIFSGMSSLTRDDLGFVTENPSSAESKKAALESLRVIAGKCQRDFTVGFINAGFVASCLRDNYPYTRNLVKDTKIIWKPLVEPDASTLSSIGDGIIKIEMHFLPDVYVPCEVCHGTRYNRETLQIKYKGKSIYDVLEMNVAEALTFFENQNHYYS